jgi:5-methylcytosine-specific restriction protein A
LEAGANRTAALGFIASVESHSSRKVSIFTYVPRDSGPNAILKEREGPFIIGYQSGNIKVDSLRVNDNIWFVHKVIKEASIPRHWNSFGLADRLNINSSNSITVEINVPLDGTPRNVSGLFAVDTESGHIWLMHRGGVGGGKQGTGKGAFLNWYTEASIEVQHEEPTSTPDYAIPIADLSASEFGKQITSFVLSVGQFKAKVRQGEIYSLSNNDLQKKIREAKKTPKKTTVETTAYDRNSYIVEYTKRRAKGVCQLCEAPAPFNDNDDRPYLECHHIIWLSEGGEDTIDNAVALCPNCHRKVHILKEADDVAKLHKKAEEKIKNIKAI